MHALVQASRGEVEFQHLHDRKVERALRRNRKRAGRRDGLFLALLRLHALDEPGQPGADVAEHALDVGRAHAGLEAIHQRIVRSEPAALGKQPRLLAADPNHLAKIFQEAAPVVRRPLSPPGVLALRGGQCLRLHQRFGQRIRIAPVAPDLAQVRPLEIVQRFLLRRAQQVR